MEVFFEYLKSLNIHTPTDVFDVLEKMEPEKIIELAFRCYELTEYSEPEKINNGIFNFSAGTAISGGIYPCSDIQCRLENVYELSVFAALYADKVLIPNYFEYMHDFEPKFKNVDQFSNFVNKLAGDLVLMLDLKPLILERIICLNPAMRWSCESCRAKNQIKEKELQKILKKVEQKIISDVAENVRFTLDREQSIVISGTPGYVATEVLKLIVLPPKLKKYIKQAPYIFNKNEVKILGLQELLISPIFNDLIVQKYSMQMYEVAYLTKHKLEARIISEINKTKETEVAENAMLQGFTHEIPFVQNASISKLLQLRKSEEGAFAIYRDAVRKTIFDLRSEKDPSKIQELVQERILPEIRKIDRIIITHGEDLSEKIKGRAILDTMVITGGLLANKLFGLDAGAIVAAVGGVSTLRDLSPDVLSLPRVPVEAKMNEYYFLWKLKNKQKK